VGIICPGANKSQANRIFRAAIIPVNL